MTKTKHPNPKQTQFNPCNTGVNPVRTHGLGVWGNERVVMSVRVDKKLKTAATRVLKAVYGSTCAGIETYLAGLVATYEQEGISGVYPRNTSIGTIVIERNLRERRKLETETYEGENEAVDRTVSVTCGFADCSEKAIAEGMYRNKRFLLCAVHLDEIQVNKPKFWHAVHFLGGGVENHEG
jgi:hypothetical protein